MEIQPHSFLRLLTQMLLFLLNFADDAILLTLSHCGFHYDWLHWVSPLLLGYTLVTRTTQLLKAHLWRVNYSAG